APGCKGLLALARHGSCPIGGLGEDGTGFAVLAGEARGGYLYVPEVSRYPVTAGYVWGAPVRAAFAAIKDGTSLSTALHADSAEDALRVLRANRVPADDLARLELIVHLRSLGDDWQSPTRRVVADVHAHGPKGLKLLRRWDEKTDRFE